ncbi:MAG: ATP-dependent helicase, partial [Cyanobacteria bacterium P01_A01_bin.83]
MKILHGTWIPEETEGLIQSGGFYLWVETTKVKQSKKSTKIYPARLTGKDLAVFLEQDLGIKNLQSDAIEAKYWLLPTANETALPSVELSRYLETEISEEFTWKYWQIDCYQTTTNIKVSGYSYEPVNNVIKLLNDLHFIALNSEELQLGADLLFWYYYTQSFKQIILGDRYIPALKYYQPKQSKGRKRQSKLEIYPGWEIICPSYEENLQKYAEAMPKLAVAGFASLPKTPYFYDEATSLSHFSECLLTEIVTHTPSTAKFSKQLSGTILEKCSDSG